MRIPANLSGLLFALALVVVTTGCRYPRDPEGTLERVQSGVLEVGVVENPPWVVEGPEGEPAGIEAEMVRALAKELDAEVVWYWSSEEKIIGALQSYQLDLGIGGIIKAPWLTQAVSTSRPFFQSHVTVGFRPGQPVPETLEGVLIAVPAVNDVGGMLKEKGARIRHAEANRPAADALAGPGWWLRALGYQTGPWKLQTQHHVWLLPPGENAWIMKVERYLAGHKDLERALQRVMEQR